MNNYPTGIGNYFSEQEEWERAIERAEERIIDEFGDGDLYEIEGEMVNEEYILKEIDLENDTLDNYRIDKEGLIERIAEGLMQ